MNHCTGMLGKRCTCGVDHGSIEGPDGEDSLFYQEGAHRSLLASPMFWFGGALAVALWTGFVWWIRQ